MPRERIAVHRPSEAAQRPSRVRRVARVGLMLYTIRDECALDLERTVATVGALGYEGVELWQLHGHEPDAVRAWLDEADLVAVGRHASADALESELPDLAAELAVLGTDRIALSWIEPVADSVPRIAELAVAARDAGLRLGFHNHGQDVQPLEPGGRTFLDLLRELPPELLWLELDVGWVWHGGGDPRSELAKTSGRCPLVHVKDFLSRATREDVPIGDGAVDYERVLPAAVEAGVEWLLVEEDDVEGPPFEAVERSLLAVRRILESVG